MIHVLIAGCDYAALDLWPRRTCAICQLDFHRHEPVTAMLEDLENGSPLFISHVLHTACLDRWHATAQMFGGMANTPTSEEPPEFRIPKNEDEFTQFVDQLSKTDAQMIYGLLYVRGVRFEPNFVKNWNKAQRSK